MKRIVILGAGESGTGSAILAKKEGFDVFVSDFSEIKEKYKKELDKRNIYWEEKGHSKEEILKAFEVIKSPGIPNTAPIVMAIREKNIPIISEIEFAGRYTKSKTICITGSNGKTTTTMLTWHILAYGGLNVGIGGNVGKSFAWQVAEDPHDYYVLELSSFQLDNTYNFKADVAVLLNITPDHLDRYNFNMQEYIDAKFRIIRNQTEKDIFVYWNDDPIISAEVKKRDIKAQKVPFSLHKGENIKAFLENKILTINSPEEQVRISQNELPLQGTHNIYNSLAAAISASVSHIKKDNIRNAIISFKAVEHRLEKVRSVENVLYINDSKATNVNSCWYALESMKKPVILILGGKDKGNDYNEIKDLVRDKVKALVFLGVNNDKLHAFFDEDFKSTGRPIADALSMKEAVEESKNFASDGDAVLLSPCCASFDLFKSYEDRGEQFKKYVMEL